MMPDAPVTYDQAQALARRLMDAQERGATLLMDGCRVVTGFRYDPEWGVIWVETVEDDFTFLGNASRPTLAEFEARWRERVTLHGRLPWPTGEAVTMDEAQGIIRLVALNLEGWLAGKIELAFLMHNAERLADVCRTLARETER